MNNETLAERKESGEVIIEPEQGADMEAFRIDAPEENPDVIAAQSEEVIARYPVEVLREDLSTQPTAAAGVAERTPDAKKSGAKMSLFSKVIVGASIALAQLGFAPQSEAADVAPEQTAAVKEVKKTKESSVSSGALIAKAQAYGESLSGSEKIALSSEVSNRKDELLDILQKEDYGGIPAFALMKTVSPKMQPILEMFLEGLGEMKRANDPEYKKTREFVTDFIQTGGASNKYAGKAVALAGNAAGTAGKLLGKIGF